MENIIESLKSVYMELGLVFDKGDSNETIKSQLDELVAKALEEARNFCPYITYKNNKLTGEGFDKLESIEKAHIIRSLGEQVGLSRFDTMESMEGKLEIEFSQHIQCVLSCTMFSILNRLENLDGTINVFNPKVELTIVAPLGGKKGLMKCEMLIMMLYPWIQIHEISSNIVATVPQERPAPCANNHITLNKSEWSSLFDKYEKNWRPLNDIDFVFCIDGTSSMKKHLDRVKKQIVDLCYDILALAKHRGKNIGKVRVRLIMFRDYLGSGDNAMLETDFFVLPDELEGFVLCLQSIKPEPSGGGAENGLEALGYAIKSPWNNNAMKKRQIIVVFTDAPTHEIGHGSASVNYPKGMAKNFNELTSWWANPECIDQREKRLIIFAPDELAWSRISDTWDNVIHFPSEAGEGLDEYSYEQIISMPFSDI